MNILSLGASANLNINSGSSSGRAQYELRIGAFLKRELEVVSFEGHEKLSTPFVYDVVFASSIPVELLQAAVFGFPACLSIQAQGHAPRVIQGLAVGLESIGAVEAELKTKTRRYMARIVPRLWLLNHSRKYRVFQDQSAVQIACAVLEDAGITAEMRLQASDYPPIPFVYQRGETDLAFLHRVLATAGVFYYFEHASGFLDALVPGAGELGALAGGLGGMAAGAASLTGSFSLAGGGSSLGGGLGGGVAGAVGSVAGAAGNVASTLGAATSLVLCDRARHTHSLDDSPAGAVGGAASAALGALGGAFGGAAGAVASAVGDVVGEVTDAFADGIPYDGNGQAATATERVFSFRALNEVRPKKVTLRDWSLVEGTGVRAEDTSALVALDVSAGLSAAVGFAQHGSFGSFASSLTSDLNVDALPIAAADASVTEYARDAGLLGHAASDAFAERALSQLRGDRITATGTSDCRRLAPGYRFKLTRHPIAPVNTEYVVTGVRSTGYAPDHIPSDCPHLYRAAFDCVPASVDPRPAKPEPRPPLGPEAAVVIGPDHGDVHCDRIGRILVRFRWADASATYAPDAPGTCWVHWLERWGGDGYGTQTLPRVGSDVLVEFLQHDGGGPIATGQLHSQQHMPAFDLPQYGTKIGIRSRSVPSGAGSEISIDDFAPRETLAIRANRDLLVDVRRDERLHVGRDQYIQVDGHVDERVSHSARKEVGGDETTVVRGSQHSTIDGDVNTTVRGRVALSATGGFEAAIGGSIAHRIAGQLALESDDMRMDVQRSHVANIGGSDTRTVGAHQVLTIGTGSVPAESRTSVLGAYRVSAMDTITLEASNGLVLRCGATEIRLTPSSLEALATAITASASKNMLLSGGGPSLALGDGINATATKVTIQSSGARLDLSSDASLTGQKVKLGNGSGASASTSAISASQKPIALSLIGPDGAALANCHYQLRAGSTLLEGDTDASGAAHVQIPPDIPAVTLTVWTKTFPEGPRVTYALDVEALGDAGSLDGAQKRLRNLGFYKGGATGQMNAATRDALLLFQLHHALPTTGQLDATTSSKLAELHP